MKLWKRLVLWVTISLTIQIVALWLINDLYLLKRGGILEVTRYEEHNPIPDSFELTSQEIQSDLKVSGDCGYAAYLLNGNIHIINLLEKSDKRMISGVNKKIQYYRWLSDRNMIIYTYSSIIDGQGAINVDTYDVESGIKREYPQIRKLEKGTEVYSIEPSSMTNTVYVILKSNDKKTIIYKYDIVDNLSFVASLGDLYLSCHLGLTDGLMVQNSINQLYILGNKNDLNRIFAGVERKYHVLGNDSKGTLYIGELDVQGNVCKIITGEASHLNNNKFKSMHINETVKPGNIIVTYDGGIYAVFKDRGYVMNLSNGITAAFNGKFFQMNENYVVSLDRTKLKFTPTQLLK